MMYEFKFLWHSSFIVGPTIVGNPESILNGLNHAMVDPRLRLSHQQLFLPSWNWQVYGKMHRFTQ
jgi:hypothetical protein